MWRYAKRAVGLSFLVVGLSLGVVVGCAELKSLGKGAGEGAASAGAQAAQERIAADPRIPDDLKPMANGLVDALKDAVPAPPAPADKTPLEYLGFALGYLVLTSLKEIARAKGLFGKNDPMAPKG